MTVRTPTPVSDAQAKSAATDIRKDLRALKNDITNLTSHAVEAGLSRVDGLRDTASEQYDRLKETSKDGFATIERRVREKPAQSLAVAFVAGIVLSLFMGGSRK